MPKPKNKILIKCLLYLPFLFMVFILQMMIFSYLPLFGVKPLILPVAVVCIALFEGSLKGGAFGLFAGILCDISFNQPVIQFTLILTFIGLLSGLLADTILIRGFPSYLLTCLLALIIIAFFQMFGLLFYKDVALSVLINTAAPQTLYSVIFTLPIYWIVRFFSRLPKS